MLRFHSPAHQTGRADFPHPAFRLASLANTRWLCSLSVVTPTTLPSSMASKVLSVTAQPLVELIGKANLQAVGLFQELARSQAPFLDRHYPASSVLRACPPPQTTWPAPHGVPVESHDLSSLGLPGGGVDSSYTHAIASTPAGPVETCRSLLDQRRPSPSVWQVGSRIARFEDCSAFTHVMACMFADSQKEPFPRVLQSE